VDWIERLIEDQSAGSSPLRCSPRKIARGAITKRIAEEEKCPLVHMLEESNVSCGVPAKLHDAKERSVVHGIKRILDVQVQQDHRMLGVALVLEKTL
jgi:hypothetical protein